MKNITKEEALAFLAKCGAIIEYKEIPEKYEDCLAQFTHDWLSFSKGDVLIFVREEPETNTYLLTTGQFCGGMIYHVPVEVIRFVERISD